MKKICALFAAVMTAATLALAACGGGDMDGVSERRSGYFTASDEALGITAVSGVREADYALDGVAGELKPYTLITVAPTEFDADALYTYTARADGAVYGGALVVHPFAASFSAELDAELTSDFEVTVSCGESVREYTLRSLVTSDMMSFDRAIDTARARLRPDGGGEVRVRLIKNPLGLSDSLCWHVVFCSADGAVGALIDPITAKTLAVKTAAK